MFKKMLLLAPLLFCSESKTSQKFVFNLGGKVTSMFSFKKKRGKFERLNGGLKTSLLSFGGTADAIFASYNEGLEIGALIGTGGRWNKILSYTSLASMEFSAGLIIQMRSAEKVAIRLNPIIFVVDKYFGESLPCSYSLSFSPSITLLFKLSKIVWMEITGGYKFQLTTIEMAETKISEMKQAINNPNQLIFADFSGFQLNIGLRFVIIEP